jgi:dienelactone hydrolase
MIDPITNDDLADFAPVDLSFEGKTKRVWTAGTGPGVIIMHEMPGISPPVLRFARWVRDAGFAVWLPSLFGTDGATGTAEDGAAVFRRACMSAEFRALGAGVSSPVTTWLMALARHVRQTSGGGVGAIGMCFTGNFALTMLLEQSVIAAVACQPSLPIDVPDGLEISDGELASIKGRLDAENRGVLAYRFAGDAFCRAERFDAYRKALGERFVGRELPEDAANREVPPFFAQHVPTPHSVVTVHLVDLEGHPSIVARDEIIQYLQQTLQGRA